MGDNEDKNLERATQSLDSLAGDDIEMDLEDMEADTSSSGSGGSDDGNGLFSLDRWTTTKNSKPLSEIEPAFDLENGGPSRLKRGVTNLLEADSMAMPIYDIPVGLIETAVMVHKNKIGSLGGSDSDDDEAETEDRDNGQGRTPRNETEEKILNK